MLLGYAMGVQQQVRAGRTTRAQSGASKTPQNGATNETNHGDEVERVGQRVPALIGTLSMIDRVSYIRLLEQSLRSLGYEDVAKALESTSGIAQSSATASRFREAVLAGEVDVALGLLGDLEEELVRKEAEVELRRRAGRERAGRERAGRAGPEGGVSCWSHAAGDDGRVHGNQEGKDGGRAAPVDSAGGGGVVEGSHADMVDHAEMMSSTRWPAVHRRVRRRVEKARYLLFCNLFGTLVEAGEAGKALKCLREDIQPLESLLQDEEVGGGGGGGGGGLSRLGLVDGEASGSGRARGSMGSKGQYVAGEDVDMVGGSTAEDIRMNVDGGLAEFPPLSTGMQNLRQAAGVKFGDFPNNFGVLSSVHSKSGVISMASPGLTDAGLVSRRGNWNEEDGRTRQHPSLSTLASMLLQVNRGAPPLPPKRLRECDGVDVHRQEQLMQDLQQLLSPEVLIPDNRLETLVEQALTSQIQRCPYHNASNASLSLMSDYHAGPDSLPTVPVHTLTLHADEVWVVQFSPDGKWLLSASKDGSAILWDVRSSKKVSFSRILHSGRVPINIGAFSPTSREVLIGSSDGKIRVFKVSNGERITELTGRSAPGYRREDDRLQNQQQDMAVSSAMWGNSSSQIALSCNKELRLLDIDIGGGAQMPSLLTALRLQNHAYDAVLSADGKSFVSVGQDRMIRYVRLVDGKVVCRGPEPAAVTCLSRSSDGKYLASNLSNGSIHIWKLGDLSQRGCTTEGRPSSASDQLDASAGQTDVMASPDSADPMDSLPDAPLFTLKGLQTSQHGRFVIRSAFGGVGDTFVATGSENALVHIWHRETEKLLTSVEGHQATVNAVAWNPRNHHMLASASDDHKVIIWLSTQEVDEWNE